MKFQSRNSEVQYKWASTLIGKAWIPTDSKKGFTPAALTTAVEGKQGVYELSNVYPLILDGVMARVSFGPNKAYDPAKNNNSHWMFLEVREDKLDEYNALLEKIGQKLEFSTESK